MALTARDLVGTAARPRSRYRGCCRGRSGRRGGSRVRGTQRRITRQRRDVAKPEHAGGGAVRVRIAELCQYVPVAVGFALGGLEDPSRPKGRILSIDAGQRAAAIAKARGFVDYEVVHVARARANEGGPEDRWIVLLDKVPHTRLNDAVVVELKTGDGTLLRIRKPH